MRLALLLPFVALPIVACGGTTPSGSDGLIDLPVRGTACAASYAPNERITIVAVDLGQLGGLGTALPGSGWQVECVSDDSLLSAENQASRRLMTFTVDSGIVGPVDIAQYAQDHLAGMRANAIAAGLDDLQFSDPILTPTGYVISAVATGAHAPFAQVSLFRVWPTPRGLIRMHISQHASTPEQITDHIEEISIAADRMQLVPPE